MDAKTERRKTGKTGIWLGMLLSLKLFDDGQVRQESKCAYSAAEEERFTLWTLGNAHEPDS